MASTIHAGVKTSPWSASRLPLGKCVVPELLDEGGDPIRFRSLAGVPAQAPEPSHQR
jgi:hypothetical protein